MKILLVDADVRRRVELEEALAGVGYHVVGKLATVMGAAAEVKRLQPDVIIIDVDNPDRSTLENMHVISRDVPRPIVMFSGYSDAETIRKAVKAGVSAYVVDGFEPGRVRPIVEVAIARFEQDQHLKAELSRAKESLADRKDIDRAKGLLMQSRSLTEPQAYQVLRSMAMNENRTLGEVARSVIALHQAIG